LCITIEDHGVVKMIKQLTKLANDLDSKGLSKEADYLDGIIRKIAAEMPDNIDDCLDPTYLLEFEFERNGFKIKNDESTLPTAHCLVGKGMKSDRKFMSIEAGTSGTGASEANEIVMHRRVNEALRYLYDSYSRLGPNELPYSYDEFKNMADIELDFNTVRPGSTLPTKEVAPKDVDHVYYKEHQHVYITIGPVSATPNFGRLARRFMEATIKRPQGITGTDDDEVNEVLKELRDADDFNAFNEELKATWDNSFNEVACHSGSESGPGWVPKWVQSLTKTLTPYEIGEEDDVVINHLESLGVPPIDCSKVK